MVTAKRARLTGMLVLALMFGVGALTGAATIRVTDREPVTVGERGERQRPDLFEKLNLTEEQRVRVDAIMERRREEMDAFWKEHGPQLRAITDSARAEMRSVLTPEQREIEEKFRAERRRHYQRH